MALTRKFLTAMGIEGEKVDEIINAHTETVDALKEERDTAKREAEQYKLDAEKLPGIQKELEDLKSEVTKGNPDPFEPKYNELKAEFDAYKQEQADKETKATKQNVYKSLLKELGISEKRLDSIMKVTDLDTIEVGDDGTLKDADKHRETALKEWSDFIEKQGEQGAPTPTPPANTGGNITATSFAAKRAAEYHANLYGGKEE